MDPSPKRLGGVIQAKAASAKYKQSLMTDLLRPRVSHYYITDVRVDTVDELLLKSLLLFFFFAVIRYPIIGMM